MKSGYDRVKSQLPVEYWSNEECLEWVANLPEHKDKIREAFIGNNVDGQMMKELSSKNNLELRRIFPSLNPDECNYLSLELKKLFKSESASSSQDAIALFFNKISPTELELEEEIAEGNFGKVFRAKYAHQDVAAKRLKLNPSLSSAEKQQKMIEFVSEAKRMFLVCFHPNIVRPLGYCVEEYTLVLEYLNKGSVESALIKRKELSDPDEMCLVIRVISFIYLFVLIFSLSLK